MNLFKKKERKKRKQTSFILFTGDGEVCKNDPWVMPFFWRSIPTFFMGWVVHPSNIDITSPSTLIILTLRAIQFKFSVTWLTLRAIQFKFSVTWSCVSLPRYTTSSDWKFVLFEKFKSQYISAFQDWMHILFLFFVIRGYTAANKTQNIYCCRHQCPKGWMKLNIYLYVLQMVIMVDRELPSLQAYIQDIGAISSKKVPVILPHGLSATCQEIMTRWDIWIQLF